MLDDVEGLATYALSFPCRLCITSTQNQNTCSLFRSFQLTSYLYLYDCRHARRSNARRVAFTKELYGYTYSWKTKSGIKQKRKPGLIEECLGTVAVADSAILVPSEHRIVFDALFQMYEDILKIRIYEIVQEII